MPPTHRFEAEPWESDAVGAWVFVTLPPDVSDDVRMEAGPPTGFGSVRVEVAIGSTTDPACPGLTRLRQGPSCELSGAG